MRTSFMVPMMLAALATTGSTLAAQASPRAGMDSAQAASIMGSGIRLLHPTAFVLDNRAELGLTADQVSRIEAIAAAQRDSEPVRARRRMAEDRVSPRGRGMSSTMMS